MEKLTIVLADDHRVVHEGLRALLEAEPDFTVLGEANDGLEAIRLTERLQPDVLLVDLAMPNGDRRFCAFVHCMHHLVKQKLTNHRDDWGFLPSHLQVGIYLSISSPILPIDEERSTIKEKMEDFPTWLKIAIWLVSG